MIIIDNKHQRENLKIFVVIKYTSLWLSYNVTASLYVGEWTYLESRRSLQRQYFCDISNMWGVIQWYSINNDRAQTKHFYHLRHGQQEQGVTDIFPSVPLSDVKSSIYWKAFRRKSTHRKKDLFDCGFEVEILLCGINKYWGVKIT